MSELESVQSEIAATGDRVKSLKSAQKAAPSDSTASALSAAVSHLQQLKARYSDLCAAQSEAKDGSSSGGSAGSGELDDKLLRASLEDLLIRRFFYVAAFEIYGGVKGLYDFGPMGCAVKQNLLSAWRRHFILEEQMLEIECTAMTPEVVLKASGHVDKFTDYMVKDDSNGEFYRADKLLEEVLEKLLADPKAPASAARRSELTTLRNKAGAMNAEELKSQFATFNIRSPSSNNPLTDPFAFNLMFQTSIGPSGSAVGYLRPETAQGIFVNYRRLLDFNNGKMPFACAQIGPVFRNEIAPRAGLLRVREFTLAEIEHFVQADKKQHPKFKDVAHVAVRLFGQSEQTSGSEARVLTIGEAVTSGLVNNETLGYYMARTHLFLLSVGIDNNKLRFRQHLRTEMAHYASDCWDAELFGTYGWVEVVGHADRSAYDLRVHSAKSKVELVAQETFDQPRLMEVASVKANWAVLGKTYGKQPSYKLLQEFLKAAADDKDEAIKLRDKLSQGPYSVTMPDGSSFELQPAMVEVKLEQKKVNTVKYTPNVIEPSFGIGRILYHILEHSFYIRADSQPQDKQAGPDNKAVRAVLRLPAHMSPVKVAVLPLSQQSNFTPHLTQLVRGFTAANVSSRADASSSSIGRRYARCDEVGIPYAVTIDFESVNDNTVTLRERDSTQQVRLAIEEVVKVVSELCNASTQTDAADKRAWQAVYSKYPQVVRAEGDEAVEHKSQ